MDEGVNIILHFDEVVRVSSIQLYRYTLMNSESLANFTYTLNGEVIASSDSNSISLKLDDQRYLGNQDQSWISY